MTEAEKSAVISGVAVDRLVMWRCCECHEGDIHGGVNQTSKARGTAGRCYWCDKPVAVYYGQSRKVAT